MLVFRIRRLQNGGCHINAACQRDLDLGGFAERGRQVWRPKAGQCINLISMFKRVILNVAVSMIPWRIQTTINPETNGTESGCLVGLQYIPLYKVCGGITQERTREPHRTWVPVPGVANYSEDPTYCVIPWEDKKHPAVLWPINSKTILLMPRRTYQHESSVTIETTMSKKQTRIVKCVDECAWAAGVFALSFQRILGESRARNVILAARGSSPSERVREHRRPSSADRRHRYDALACKWANKPIIIHMYAENKLKRKSRSVWRHFLFIDGAKISFQGKVTCSPSFDVKHNVTVLPSVNGGSGLLICVNVLCS